MPEGLVIAVLPLKLNVPAHPVIMSTAESPPFSVFVPLKLTVPSAFESWMPVPALLVELRVPV